MLGSLRDALGASIVEHRLAYALNDARSAGVATRQARRVRTRGGNWRRAVSRSAVAIQGERP